VALSLRSRTIGSLAVLVTCALILGSSVVLAPEVHALASITTLTYVEGDVFVGRGDEVVVAREGYVLVAGDSIRTGAGAKAELTYFEGSSVRLHADTELVIEALATDSDGGTVVAMRQVLGRTWHVVTKLITGGSRYEVRTPTSTASVRGTIFAVDVRLESDGPAATVTTSEGTVVHHVPDSNRAGATTDIRVGAGEQSTSERGKPASPPRAAPASTLREAPTHADRTPRPAKKGQPERSARTDVRAQPEARSRDRTELRSGDTERARGGRDRAKLREAAKLRTGARDRDD
jgi:hypothetical protein